MAAVLLMHAGVPPAMAATERPWVPVSLIGEPGEYFIEAASVHRQGDVTHYHLLWRSVGSESHPASEAQVGVRCASGERAEFVATTRWRGNAHTEVSTEFRRVRPGSRAAREIEVACKLGDDLARAGTRPAPPQATLDRAPLPQPVRSTGTAFALGGDLVVTNRHVVDSCGGVVALRGTERLPARPVAQNRNADLALVQVPGLDLAPLPLADAPPELGEPVVVLGFPLPNLLGPQVRVSTGIVSALGGLATDEGAIQISAPVQPGNSGGPVLDAAGRVVGVVARKMDQRLGVENIGFAVDLPTLRGFLAAQGRAPRVVPGALTLTVAEVARRTAGSLVLIACA